jgi:hypothetical protein
MDPSDKILFFQFCEIHRSSVFSAKNSIVTSESMAKKYFDNGDALGKRARISGGRSLVVPFHLWLKVSLICLSAPHPTAIPSLPTSP